MELLSPAKNIEIAKVAINCGADAVYIGATNFGARKAASNSISDIEKLCNYAHFYKSRVFVTLNTIIFENELESVRKIVNQLYNVGVDALIIQDLALLELDLPPIELHASTQMHNFDIQRIKFLDKLGFKRIVLAREYSLQQIKLVKKTINAEIECFVHGALCVSFSGQCYMSANIGGRSANRGECAQACRLKYSLKNSDGKQLLSNKYLLSLKDLNLSEQLPYMLDVGVDSIKIEGRLKDVDYVAHTTAYYRTLLDALLEERNLKNNSSGKVYYDFVPDLNKVFNRGFTNYFFDEDNSKKCKMADFSTPKFKGEFVGKVISIDKKSICLSSDIELNNGDGFTYLVGNQLFGFRAEKVESKRVFVSSIAKNLTVGVEIFRNYDVVDSKKVENTKTKRKIEVSFTLKNVDNSNFELFCIDEDGVSVSKVFINNFQLAVKQENAIVSIKKSLQKGGDFFDVKNVELLLENVPFISNSIINELRRDVLKMLENKRIESFKPLDYNLSSGRVEYFLSSGDYKLNVANSLAQRFYENHGCKIIEPAFELLKKKSDKELMTTKYCIRRECDFCPKNNKNIAKEWLTDSFLLSNDYGTFVLKFDCANCVMRIFAK